MSERIIARRDWCTETPEGHILTARAVLTHLSGNKHAYFSITGELYDRTDRLPFEPSKRNAAGRVLWLGSCGQLHEDIKRHLSEAGRFVKWHLVDATGEPMHYVANSLYWAGFSGYWDEDKKDSPPNVAHFKSTCVYGALPSDEQFNVEALIDEARAVSCWPTSEQFQNCRARAEAWLVGRRAALAAAFFADMKELFGEQINTPDEAGITPAATVER